MKSAMVRITITEWQPKRLDRAPGRCHWYVFALFGMGLAGCAPPVQSPPLLATQLPPLQSGTRDPIAAAVQGLSYGTGRLVVSVDVAHDAAKAKRAFDAAQHALNVENIPVKAAGLFRDAILADPRSPLAYAGIARALHVKGDPALVRAALNTALDLDPDFDQARFELGVAAQMRGDYAGAVSIWSVLVVRNPDYPDAYARMAIAAYYDQDIETALRYLSEADRRKQNVPPQFRTLLPSDGARP